MSRNVSLEEHEQFDQYIEQLEHQTKPSPNDIREKQNTSLINCFLERIGSKERVYVLGSTAEESKLTFLRRNEGDVDILLVSGKIEISTDQLERNPSFPCYVRICANDTSRKLGLKVVEGKYLSANSLREVRPELFTFLRAYYVLDTAIFDRLPEVSGNTTKVSVSSKVGLTSHKYTGLNFRNKIPSPENKQKHTPPLRENASRLKACLRKVTRHKQDIDFFRKLVKAIKIATHQGARGSDNGRLAFYAQALTDFMPQEDVTLRFTESETDDAKPEYHDDEDHLIYNNHVEAELTVLATYEKKVITDFVPAFVVKGQIEEMKDWRQRAEACNWPEYKISEICRSEVFVVSRVSPVNPNVLKDFCLSFNLAEKKLVQSFTSVQRQVYLILKAYLKGYFENTFNKEGRPFKLKTYHIKTLLFWLFENQQSNDVYTTLQRSLVLLRQKMCERCLPHYFVKSANLLCEFEEEDIRLTIECIDYSSQNPLETLKYFFDLDQGEPVQIVLSPEEISCLSVVSTDHGMERFIDTFEEVSVDLIRCLNEVERDKGGNTAAKEALLEVCKQFLKNEQHKCTFVFKAINTILTGDSQYKTDMNMKAVNQRIEEAIALVQALGKDIPQVHHFIQTFGGQPGLRDIFRGAFGEKPLDFDTDLENQILETLERFLSCSDKTEDDILAELKYKSLGYFIVSKWSRGNASAS